MKLTKFVTNLTRRAEKNGPVKTKEATPIIKKEVVVEKKEEKNKSKKKNKK